MINTDKEQPDWIFSYGDLLNYYLNDAFYCDSNGPQKNDATGVELLSPGARLYSGAPAESYLPTMTRKFLKEVLVHNGIREPKVILIYNEEGEVKGPEIFFNFTPAGCQNEQKFNSIMQTLAWYLPRHYSIAAADEKSFSNDFMPL